MSFAPVTYEGKVAVVTMTRGKVNAFDATAIGELGAVVDELATDPRASAMVLTGQGKFFSFGFDVPQLLTYAPETLRDFLVGFNDLMHRLYLFPAPLVAAINGHATAGGCMLATTADYRVMAAEGAKISLNEINIGVPVFAGPTAILEATVGHRDAELVLSIGRMYSPDEALTIGLVDTLMPAEAVLESAIHVADDFAGRNPDAFGQIKRLLREPVADACRPRENAAIDRFIDVWFSERTQAQLREVQIRT